MEVSDAEPISLKRFAWELALFSVAERTHMVWQRQARRALHALLKS